MKAARQTAKTAHPSTFKRPKTARAAAPTRGLKIAGGPSKLELKIGDRVVTLTNLDKIFWTNEKITKGDLLQYYADIAPVLLPHLQDRAMVMKRYPGGADKPFF